MQFEVVHTIQPGFVQRTLLAEPEDTIASFLEHSDWKFKLPTICVVNGQPVMRRDWASTTISNTDIVEFVSRPYGSGGGGGKIRQVASLLALIAIAAIAPWAAGPAGLALSGFAYYATVAAITVAGGLLVSTFLNPKAATNKDEPIAQLYSLTASGNVASPLEPISVQYGRLKVEPKYAGAPWHEYIGDDLFLNIPLALGVGVFDHEQILVDDTVMWDHITGLQSGFNDVTWQYVEPGDRLTLFPSNVVESTEVSGQSVTEVPSPYFVVNAPSTHATKIIYDIIFPGGLFTTSPEGQFGNASVQLFGFVQKIDDAGTSIGAPIEVVNVNITMCNRNPKRVSLECPNLASGRYSARLYRQNPESTSTTVQDAVVWAGLRGFLEGGDTFEDVSVLALRMKATAQLSQNAAKRIGVIQTRKLPVWNGSGFTIQATQNAFWAFLDAATNEVYGANRPLSKIDLNAIIAQAAAADLRGDTFNYIFGNSQVTFQAAFDLILQSARSKVSWVGDILSVVRDEWKPIPQMLITDQQIVRGSLNVDYIFNEEESADCVVGQFLNENTWGPAQLQYPPNEGDFIGQKPSTVRIEGITNPAHLYEELGFLYRQSQLRRVRLRLDTEHDGRLLRFGSAVKVQSFLPNKWGTSGEVNSYNVGSHVLTVSREMPQEVGQHYIELRDKGGHYFGPVKCSLVFGHPNQVQIDVDDLAIVEASLGTTLDAALARMDGADPPSFAFGLAGNLSRSCIVITGKPSEDKVTLELTIDSEAVHVTNAGALPPQPTAPTLRDPRVPVIFALEANFQQGVAEPYLIASWWPSVGALYYRVQVSYDEGTSWTPYPDQSEPNFSDVVSLASLRIRVAAVNSSFHGPWSEKDVEAPTITIGPSTVNPASLKQGLHDYVMKQLMLGADEDNKARQLIASVAAEHDAARALEFIDENRNRAIQNLDLNTNIQISHDFLQQDINTKTETLTSTTENLQAQITTTQQTATDTTAAQATVNTVVSAHLTNIDTGLVTTNAAVTTNSNAIVTTNASLASLSTSVTASIASTNSAVAANTASIVTNATAIATTNSTVATLTTSVSSQFTAVNTSLTNNANAIAVTNANVATNATAITNANAAFASYQVSVTATYATLSNLATTNANVTTNANAITSANTAFSNYQTMVAATYATLSGLATTNASVSTNATAISNTNTALSNYETMVTATYATLGGLAATNANVSTNAIAIASTNSAFSSYQTTVNAHLGSLDSSVTTNASAVATVSGALAAVYTLELDVNGFVSGYRSTNTGAFATFTVLASIFQIADPGTPSAGAPVPVFAVQAVNGIAKISFRGDMFADGTITTNSLSALSVTTAKLAAGAVVATTISAQAVSTTQLAINGVDITNIIPGAATKSYLDTWPSHSTGSVGTFFLLGSGQPTVNNPVTHSILGGTAHCTMNISEINFGGTAGVISLLIDGSSVQDWSLNGDFATSLVWVVNGLSAAGHTFQVRFNSGANPMSWLNGQLYVVDLRR